MVAGVLKRGKQMKILRYKNLQNTSREEIQRPIERIPASHVADIVLNCVSSLPSLDMRAITLTTTHH